MLAKLGKVAPYPGVTAQNYIGPILIVLATLLAAPILGLRAWAWKYQRHVHRPCRRRMTPNSRRRQAALFVARAILSSTGCMDIGLVGSTRRRPASISPPESA